MKSKFLSFKRKGPVIDSKGPAITASSDGEIIDHGTLGKLNYVVYKRGVIKISKDGIVFKKDINLFENEIAGIDFNAINEDVVIKGSGDNDNLVFSKVNDEIEISLKKRGFAAIDTLRNVLNKGKKKLLNGGN